MDSILQLCESRETNYPDHFKIFLDNCLKKYDNTFLSNDYLFAAVYFIVLESGFSPIDLYDEYPELCTDSFDIRKLRCVKSYSTKHLKSLKTKTSEYFVYGIPLRLGTYRCECELQGVPSTENSTYLIVNFLTALGTVKSVCLSTEIFIEYEDETSKYLFRLKNLEMLTMLIREKLSNHIKELIMLNIGQGCIPHLLRLPEDIQKKIIYFLIGNAADVQNLASTCTYFYNVITNDFKLWERLCMTEFDGKCLNDALEDVMQSPCNDDFNIFRRVFIELKKKKLYRPYNQTARVKWFC